MPLPTFRCSISPSSATATALSLALSDYKNRRPHPSASTNTSISNTIMTCCAPESSKLISSHRIPGISSGHVADQTFGRYKYNGSRKGSGVAIVWFRNDLRILDNEALFNAWLSSASLLPVYFFDPRLFSTTHSFNFPKTGVCLSGRAYHRLLAMDGHRGQSEVEKLRGFKKFISVVDAAAEVGIILTVSN